MDKESLPQVLTQSLKALGDNRVMFPSDSVEAISDLKSLIRGMLSGQYQLVQTTPKKEPKGETK